MHISGCGVVSSCFGGVGGSLYEGGPGVGLGGSAGFLSTIPFAENRH